MEKKQDFTEEQALAFLYDIAFKSSGTRKHHAAVDAAVQVLSSLIKRTRSREEESQAIDLKSILSS